MAKVTMAIKIDQKVKDKLKELAEKEDRNLSNFVLRAVYTHVKPER
jgi:predicted transcriptional regulator